MDEVTKRRFFRLTPNRLLLALLPIWVGLLLCEHFRWLSKGYPVLLAVASMVVVVVVLFLWLAVAVVFRWRFQYSLRTLLFVILLASIGMSWVAVETQKARRQKEMVDEIKKSGGYAHYDYGVTIVGLQSPKNKAKPVWLRNFLGEDFLASIAYVGFADSPVSQSTLEHLRDLTELQLLEFSGPCVDDASLDHLQRMTQIQALFLNDSTQITDVGLEHLKGLTQLQLLHIDGTQVTDAGLQQLEGLTNLRELLLWNNAKITDDGVRRLIQALPKCKFHL